MKARNSCRQQLFAALSPGLGFRPIEYCRQARNGLMRNRSSLVAKGLRTKRSTLRRYSGLICPGSGKVRRQNVLRRLCRSPGTDHAAALLFRSLFSYVIHFIVYSCERREKYEAILGQFVFRFSRAGSSSTRLLVFRTNAARRRQCRRNAVDRGKRKHRPNVAHHSPWA